MRYVLVAGEGETSRENVEAILEDYFYAHKGEDLVMVVPFYKSPSRGQVYAMQMAKENKAEIIVYAPQSARLENTEKASLEVTDTPISSAVDLVKGLATSAYILWSDEGSEALQTLEACRAESVAAYDLTAGGIPLTNLVEPITAPSATPMTKPKPTAVQEALDALVEAIRESVLNGSK